MKVLGCLNVCIVAKIVCRMNAQMTSPPQYNHRVPTEPEELLVRAHAELRGRERKEQVH